MNKYKTLVLVMFFLLVFCCTKVNAIVNNYSLLGKVIYLDAGHGGPDSGAISKSIMEKDINLAIVHNLEAFLVGKGAVVLLTRSDDYDLATSKYNRKRADLSYRAKLINEAKPDMFVSIHLNSTINPTWQGIQIFYNSSNEQNKVIATTINNALKDNFSNIREIKEENNFFLPKQVKVPGVLIEAGFLSNPHDRYLLKSADYQNQLSEIIVKGIENYLQNQ